MDNSWLQRLKCDRRFGNIPALQYSVLVVLCELITIGDHHPSEARLMAAAIASRSTVQRAKRTARELGLLSWVRNFDWDGGIRREKPCTYCLEFPLTPPVRRERQKEARKEVSYSKILSIKSVAQQVAAFALPTREEREAIRSHKAKVAAGAFCQKGRWL